MKKCDVISYPFLDRIGDNYAAEIFFFGLIGKINHGTHRIAGVKLYIVGSHELVIARKNASGIHDRAYTLTGDLLGVLYEITIYGKMKFLLKCLSYGDSYRVVGVALSVCGDP